MEEKEPETEPTPGLISLEELIRFVETTPAVLWAGKGGVKERLLKEYRSRK